MPKREKPSKVRGSAASGLENKRNIFTTEDSDIVQGEILLQLDSNAAATVTSSIPKGPTRGATGIGVNAFGISELDAALSKLGVTSVVRLHPPAPVFSAAKALAAPMAETFRVTFERRTQVSKAVEQLSEVNGVLFAEANRYRETYAVPNDPSYPAQWGLAKINCPAAWDRTTGSANVVVAVIDTGIDLDHPELAPLLVPGMDMVDLGINPTPPPGFRFEGDFQGRDSVPQDEVGHGTHVAGTIACLSNNGVGVAGVTWNCRIMPVRVLARIANIANPGDVRGVGSAADIAAGIRWAVDNGARILSLSLGGPTDTQVERDAIAYAIAHGAVVVAAMGNGGPNATASYPGAYPDVVAVGAIDQTDHLATFSQVGPHIDLVGPGVGILSTVWDNGYATMSGTSMATPHVSGVAALVLSCNSNLTGPQVADILRQTARPLRDAPTDPVPNDRYGFGCVDAEAAVNRACPARPSQIIISCRPSLLIRCTQTITCRRTNELICRISKTIPCKTELISCRVSSQVICPSRDLSCPTSELRCRTSGFICQEPGPEIPREELQPFGQGGGMESGAGWGGYDPYEEYYEEDPYKK